MEERFPFQSAKIYAHELRLVMLWPGDHPITNVILRKKFLPAMTKLVSGITDGERTMSGIGIG